MGMVDLTYDGSVAIVTMNNGANRHNLDFMTELKNKLDEALENKDVKAAVLTSADEKSWSQGVDVEWLGARMAENNTEDIKAFMYAVNSVFKTLLLYPVPSIAAINGHAFGNGAILSCACDFRFMRADRGYFCFPEVDLGIPFLPGMISFMRKTIPEHRLYDFMLTGKRAGGGEMEAEGVVVKAVEGGEATLASAVEFAKTFDKKRGIFKEIKKRLHKEIIETIDNQDPEFIEPLFLMVSE